MSPVVKRKATWRVVIVNRLGLDMLHFDEMPLKRRFRTKTEATRWAREHFGSSKLDLEGWRVEREKRVDSVNLMG
jgi:hypothetical protein